MSNNKLYNLFMALKKRCNNKNDQAYKSFIKIYETLIKND